jgi:hypothetical protein
MSQVLADPLAVRKRCKRAQERVRLFYSSQTMAKNYLAVYATAIQKAADRLAGQKVVQV